MNNKRKVACLTLVPLLLLAGCSESGNNGTWAYPGEGDAKDDIIRIESGISYNEASHTGTLTAEGIPYVISSVPTNGSVFLFDAEASLTESGASSLEEVPYEYLKKNEVEMDSITMPESLDEMVITYKKEDSHKVGALIHPSCTYRNKYALVTPYQSAEENWVPIEVNSGDFDFEEKYLKSESSGVDTASIKMAIDIGFNIASIVTGGITENPAMILGGVMGIFNSVWGRIFGGPDIAGMIKKVMEKLNAMDKKLDALSQTLAKNYENLLAETIKTQGLVQDVMIRQMNSDVASFQQTYIDGANDIRREIGVYLQDCYRTFVKGTQSVTAYYRKNGEKYEPVSIADTSTESKSQVQVNFLTFPNAKAFLQTSDDVLGEGFFDAYTKDLQAIATEHKNEFPSDMSKEDIATIIHSPIQEGFVEAFWTSNPGTLTKYENLLINMSRRICASDGTNVLDSYLNRLKYLCNFSDETTNMAISILAGLLYQLDSNVANALMAGAYLHREQSELKNIYVTASKNIRNWYTNWKALPEHYSFVAGTQIHGEAVSLIWKNEFTKLGNHPDFATHVDLDRLTMVDGKGFDTPRVLYVQEKRYSTWNLLSEPDYLKISLRTRLMQSLGLVDAKMDFTDYLVSSGLFVKDSIEAYKKSIDLYGGRKYEDALYLTPVTSRALQDSDKGLDLWCDFAGNPGGSYFKVGESYKFKDKYDAGCWSGTGLECATISRKTGNVSNPKELVAAFAKYDEGHSKWKNDEHWSFNIGRRVNPYLILTY